MPANGGMTEGVAGCFWSCPGWGWGLGSGRGRRADGWVVAGRFWVGSGRVRGGGWWGEGARGGKGKRGVPGRVGWWASGKGCEAYAASVRYEYSEGKGDWGRSERRGVRLGRGEARGERSARGKGRSQRGAATDVGAGSTPGRLRADAGTAEEGGVSESRASGTYKGRVAISGGVVRRRRCGGWGRFGWRRDLEWRLRGGPCARPAPGRPGADADCRRGPRRGGRDCRR